MQIKLGMNLLLWGTEIDDRLFPVLEQIKSCGYDGVEIPIFNTYPTAWESWRKKLDELQLGRVAVTINGPDAHQISSDAAMRESTLERNKRALDCAAALGSELLTGPFHSALGVFTGKASTEQERDWAKENLYQLAEYAKQYGIVLGLEYLNRFESYLVTTTDELIQLVDEINHPNCKLMFDSFHANIEEQNMAAAIQRMGNRLVHVQLSENDRGILGRGHVDFSAILNALDQIGYSGMVSVEAFSAKLAAANIWRKMFDSEMQLVQESYHYLKSIIHEN
jgi:D-psicose/D-tagatose/L-ribulose 3-epimerase